mmetsp:Transcript_4196/g.12663  ORF Transcript_4196/g.12663 Transcript_4196/m.12663 type:complete len:229 (-) Transcript_4196:27-713(-)
MLAGPTPLPFWVLDDLPGRHAELPVLRRVVLHGDHARPLLRLAPQLLGVHGLVLGKDGHRNLRVGLPVVVGDVLQGLQLHKGLGRLLVVLVVKRGEREQRVDVLCLEDALVFLEEHRDPHGAVQVALVQKRVREVPVVQSLCTLPRIAVPVLLPNIHGQKAVQDLAGTPHWAGRHGSVQGGVLHRVKLQSAKDVELLRLSGVRHLLRLRLCDLEEELGGLVVLVSLPE